MIEAIIFDYNRTLVQGEKTPPRFYPDTMSVLETLKNRGIRIAVVSVGEDPQQRIQEFEQLGLNNYVTLFKIVGKSDRKDLQPVLDELQVEATACVVIGDRIKKEIMEGNKVGATTVWLQQGKFADEKPESVVEQPDYTISSLAQLIPILDRV